MSIRYYDRTKHYPKKYADKFICHFSLADDVSKVKAIQTLAVACDLSLQDAKLLFEAPYENRVLSYRECEYLAELVLTAEELGPLLHKLEPYFDLAVHVARRMTVGIGNGYADDVRPIG